MENEVEVRVSARLENLAVLRTLVAAVGTFEDLDMDTVSDLRLAVDEACTRLIRSAVPGSTLKLQVRPTDTEVTITASTDCAGADVMAPGSFSWHVLNSLLDEVAVLGGAADGQDGEPLDATGSFGIAMTTRRASSLR